MASILAKTTFGKLNRNGEQVNQDIQKVPMGDPLQPQPTEQHGSTASEDATTPATETGPAFLK